MNKKQPDFSWDRNILSMLRVCGRKLLITEDETQHPDFYVAFAYVAEACKILYALDTQNIDHQIH